MTETTTTDDSSSSSTSFKPFAKSNQEEDDEKDVDNDEMDIPPLTAQFVAVSLQQLKAKLDSTPYDMKSSFVYAQQLGTDLVNDNHFLGFLYVEKFNIDVSSTGSTRHDS